MDKQTRIKYLEKLLQQYNRDDITLCNKAQQACDWYSQQADDRLNRAIQVSRELQQLKK